MVRTYCGYVGEQYGVARASHRHERSIRPGRDLEVEDVWCLALIEDEEDLGEMAVACRGFDIDDLVDTGFE